VLTLPAAPTGLTTELVSQAHNLITEDGHNLVTEADHNIVTDV